MSGSIVGRLLALLVLSAAVVSTRADDASFGGSGAAIYPIATADVSLEREVVTFVEGPRGQFFINAVLIFRNDTNNTIEISAGFPDQGVDSWDGTPEDPEAQSFIQDLSIYVNGRAVPTIRRQKVKRTEKNPWSLVYVFPLSFAARSQTVVVHNYHVGGIGFSNGERELPYLFRTGGYWKGAIKEAIFEYRFALPPAGLRLVLGDQIAGGWTGQYWMTKPSPRAAPGVDYSFTYRACPLPRLVVTFRNVKPTSDITIHTGPPLKSAAQVPSLASNPLMGFATADQTTCAERLLWFLAHPYSPSPEVLACYEPWVLRNALFATKGYIFKSCEYVRAFYDSGLLTPPPINVFAEECMSRIEQEGIAQLQRLAPAPKTVSKEDCAGFAAPVPGIELNDDVSVNSPEELDKTLSGVGTILGRLTVSLENSDDQALERIVRSLKRIEVKGGVSLFLRGPEVTDAGMQRLKDLKSLRRLDLASAQVTDAGLEALKGLVKLEYLFLDGVGVTDTGLQTLTDLRSLTDLYLGETQVTDAGMRWLKDLPHLRSLRLGYTKVTDTGLQHLRSLRTLRYLDLRATTVSDAGVEALKKQVPGINIRRD